MKSKLMKCVTTLGWTLAIKLYCAVHYRMLGAAISASITGVVLSFLVLLNVPSYLAGSLKIIYDLALYRSFRSIKPPEERV